MSIKASVLARSTSQPVIATPSYAASPGVPPRVAAQYGVASPGVPRRVAAQYAPPRTYAASPGQPRSPYPGVGRATTGNPRALQVETLAPTLYAGAPPPTLTYAAPPQWGSSYAREQLVVEPNGMVDRVYAAAPPTMLEYAAPVQTIIEVVRDESQILALRAELMESVVLVQEYQRKNNELLQYKTDLELRLSACEVRNGELQHQNNNQRDEINSLLRRNEELMSLNLSLQEKVRELEKPPPPPEQKHKPVHHEHHEKPPPPPAPEPEGSDDDKIEQLIGEFIRDHPDFPIEVERVKPLWYQFSGPINKKINFKVQGHNVLARVGGGFDEARKWLTEQRHEFLEAEGIMVEEERENSAGAGMKGRQLGSHVSRGKRSLSGGKNSTNGR